LGKPKRVQIADAALRYDAIGHMMDHEADGTAFVRTLGTAMLDDANTKRETADSFDGPSLSRAVRGEQPPLAIVMASFRHSSAALRAVRTPITFSDAVDADELVLVQRGSGGTYLLGTGAAHRVGPNMIVDLPAHVARYGNERARVLRIRLSEPDSLLVPVSGPLPF
jgi:hypothetical protein